MRHLAWGVLSLACACGTEPVVEEDRRPMEVDPAVVWEEPTEEPAAVALEPERIRDDWLPPVVGRITSRFGERDGSFHDALDISSSRGSWVVAPADMRIRLISYQRRAGRFLVADAVDAPYRLTFAHLSHVAVNEGQRVKRGERIGTTGISGSVTGPHLHFRVEHVEGGARTAIDPLTILREERIVAGR